MNVKNVTDNLIAIAQTVACASPHVPQNAVENFNKEHPNAFKWVEEEIRGVDWMAFRKLVRNEGDIQRRWNDRLERNRLKQSVAGLGQDTLGKKI